MTARSGGERGVALIIALLAMMLLGALGLALSLTMSTESQISSTYRDGREALHATDAAVEIALLDVLAAPDWNAILDGSVTSTFVDGPIGVRRLPNGALLDLAEATARVRCARPACGEVEMNAYSEDRPWGPNNPRWQPFAYGPLANLNSQTIDSRMYVVVWVGDDPSETDDQPLLDGDARNGPNPGLGLISMLAHAYGPAGAHRAIEATVARTEAAVGILSWRELR